MSISSEAKNWWQPIPEKRPSPAVQIGPLRNAASLKVTTLSPELVSSNRAEYLRILSSSGTTGQPEPISSVSAYLSEEEALVCPRLGVDTGGVAVADGLAWGVLRGVGA